MEHLLIQNKDEKVSLNFSMKEYWAPKFGGHLDFSIPQCLLDAEQILRDYFGAMLITSTFRPGDTFGFHRYLSSSGAVDSIPIANTIAGIDKFKQECLKYQDLTGSELITKLRKAGVEGFGLESNNCIHLDFRAGQNVVDTDEFGKYIVFSWDAVNGSKVYYRV